MDGYTANPTVRAYPIMLISRVINVGIWNIEKMSNTDN